MNGRKAPDSAPKPHLTINNKLMAMSTTRSVGVLISKATGRPENNVDVILLPQKGKKQYRNETTWVFMGTILIASTVLGIA
jgi:hypothetical protein